MNEWFKRRNNFKVSRFLSRLSLMQKAKFIVRGNHSKTIHRFCCAIWIKANVESSFLFSPLLTLSQPSQSSRRRISHKHSQRSKTIDKLSSAKSLLTLNFSFFLVKHRRKHELKHFQSLWLLIDSKTAPKLSCWAKSIETLLNESTRISDETISVGFAGKFLHPSLRQTFHINFFLWDFQTRTKTSRWKHVRDW